MERLDRQTSANTLENIRQIIPSMCCHNSRISRSVFITVVVVFGLVHKFSAITSDFNCGNLPIALHKYFRTCNQFRISHFVFLRVHLIMALFLSVYYIYFIGRKEMQNLLAQDFFKSYTCALMVTNTLDSCYTLTISVPVLLDQDIIITDAENIY